jgi:benzoyl-CoA reductase/2-hydroxyglutaryl-CoA dehydratase subunit BcrC/BadD/HgdB
MYELQRRVQERTGITSVIVDGDTVDMRVFSLAQYETRIQAFKEMMEDNRDERGNRKCRA